MSIAALVFKELRELLMEKTIIIGVVLMPLIILPLTVGVLSIASQSAALPRGEIPMILIDMDGGRYSVVLQEALKTSGFRLLTYHNTRHDVVSLMKDRQTALAVIVEKGFSQNLTVGRKASVKFFMVLNSISASEIQRVSTAQSRIAEAIMLLGEALAVEKGVKLSYYKEPVLVRGELIYRDRVMSMTEVGTISQLYLSTSLLMFVVLLTMVTTSGAVAATSIGLEKEAKTLEILLTMPISRAAILSAKLIASTTIALLGTTSMIVGFIIYLTGLPLPSPSAGFILPFNIFSIAFLALILFIAMVTMLSLGIMAGVLAGDVRGAQQLAGLLEIPLIFPSFLLLLLTDISDLSQPLLTAMMLNPFTHMFLAIRAVYEEAYLVAASHAVVMLAFMVAVLGLAAWFFHGDRLLTMRVSLRRSPQRS